MSPRSSPANRNPPASSSSTSVSTTRPLCMPAERTSTTARPGSSTRSWRAAASVRTGISRCCAAAGVVQLTGVDGDRQALLLDVRPGRVGAAQQAGQLAHERREAVRRQRGDDPAVRRRPALVAVLAEEVEVAAGLGEGVADVVQAAERERLPGGPAGDHGDGERLVGQREEDLRRVGVDVGLGRVVDDRREHPVEVEPDDGARQLGRQRVVPLAGRRRGELHGAKPTTPRTGRSGEGQPSSPVSTTVSRSSFIGLDGRLDALDAEVEGEQPARGLEPLGEVDGGGRDRADPVVGPDDLPPARRSPGRRRGRPDR